MDLMRRLLAGPVEVSELGDLKDLANNANARAYQLLVVWAGRRERDAASSGPDANAAPCPVAPTAAGGTGHSTREDRKRVHLV
ncbi:hypothetical protein P3T36_007413 [Kitasatospora sp. MAP12-15]|uniref:hypothetical protein n=1 Tax=unclassified Kitasatospora TaxID=2633591 RepID=UPI002474868A|nr:hypothetical protein [Kitasatospora sp. MAP12-44]MDH6109201.1 hypothetical protein [Kitasatospora sp. MAP12-44]